MPELHRASIKIDWPSQDYSLSYSCGLDTASSMTYEEALDAARKHYDDHGQGRF